MTDRVDLAEGPTEAGPRQWRLGRRPELDGLRGVAIAVVVAFHLAPNALPGGKIGVDLFFVLSGFLITALLIEESARRGSINLAAFYTRRARRLLPALGLLLVVLAVLLACEARWSGLASLGWVAIYGANYARAAGHLTGIAQHCWSLALEEQFYIVWPPLFGLLLFIRARWITALIVVGGIAAVVAHRLAGNGPQQSDLGIDVRADALLIGCLLAIAFAWFGAANWRWSRLAMVSVPLVVVAIVEPWDFRGYGYTIVALLFALNIGGALTWAPMREMLSVTPLRWLGLISYSLYLWHYPVIYWVRGNRAGGIYDVTVANVIVSLALSIGLACASYYLVERRFLRPRVEAAPAAPPPA